MQQGPRPAPSIHSPTRLVKYTYPFALGGGERGNVSETIEDAQQPATGMYVVGSSLLLLTSPFDFDNQPSADPGDISSQSTHLMQLSGMMQAIRLPRPQADTQKEPGANETSAIIEEYWPNGIQQTGALPVINLYGAEPFGRSSPGLAVIPQTAKPQPAWQAILNTPAAKVVLGLLVGIGLLYLVSKFVDIPTTIQVLRQNLATPRG